MSARKRGYARPKNTKKTIGRILGYMGKYKSLWVLVFICSIIGSGVGVAGSYLIKPALNNYIIPFIGQQNVDLTGFGKLLLGVLIMFIIGAVATWCNSRIMLYISTNLLFNMRIDLFTNLEKLPIKFFDSHSHGELMSRFTNDIDTLREMLSQTVPQFLSSIITVISVFVMMIILSPLLTAVMIITIILLGFVIAFVGKRSAKSFRQNQKSVGELNGFIEEMIEGQKVIKVFNHQEKAEADFDILNDNVRKAGTSAMTYGGIIGPLITNISHMQYAVIAIVSSIFMILGEGGVINFTWFTGVLNIGTIAAFLQYSRSFSQPIASMSMQANSVLNALAGAERIFAVIDEEHETDNGKYTLVNAYEVPEKNSCDGDENNTKLVESFAETGHWAWKNPDTGNLKRLAGEVVFNHVTFGYKPDKTILHDICIHAYPGKKIALVGSTGSGKTTTINLLSRFYDVPEGQGHITFDGIQLNDISKDDLRHSLGIVQQNVNLFTGTIKDNIRYGNLEASDKQIYDAAHLANADSFIKHLENGYDTVISGDGSSLSQGQCQLLSIARTAVANPPVLILDEATSSIDTRTEKLIEQGMNSLMKGRTTFVIAHRLSTVRNADEIVVLEHGQIIERGTHDQLIEAKGRYYFLYTGNRIGAE